MIRETAGFCCSPATTDAQQEFVAALTSMELGLTRREINAIMFQVDRVTWYEMPWAERDLDLVKVDGFRVGWEADSCLFILLGMNSYNCFLYSRMELLHGITSTINTTCGCKVMEGSKVADVGSPHSAVVTGESLWWYMLPSGKQT